MRRLWVVVMLVCLLVPSGVWAGTYYIDPSQTDPDEDGSIEHPFDSWSDIRYRGLWAAGNSYLQRRGTAGDGIDQCIRPDAIRPDAFR